MSKDCSSYLLIVVYVFIAHLSSAQNETAPKPLFDDPVYHGAADPAIIYNKQKKKWWMFYTNRRANAAGTSGVKWVHGLSQVFIAVDSTKLGNHSTISAAIYDIIEDYHRSVPIDQSKEILYPGERALRTRKRNLKDGIPVMEDIWERILELEKR